MRKEVDHTGTEKRSEPAQANPSGTAVSYAGTCPAVERAVAPADSKHTPTGSIRTRKRENPRTNSVRGSAKVQLPSTVAAAKLDPQEERNVRGPGRLLTKAELTGARRRRDGRGPERGGDGSPSRTPHMARRSGDGPGAWRLGPSDGRGATIPGMEAGRKTTIRRGQPARRRYERRVTRQEGEGGTGKRGRCGGTAGPLSFHRAGKEGGRDGFRGRRGSSFPAKARCRKHLPGVDWSGANEVQPRFKLVYS